MFSTFFLCLEEYLSRKYRPCFSRNMKIKLCKFKLKGKQEPENPENPENPCAFNEQNE